MSADIGAVLSALSDPTRRELVDLLAASGPRTASELADHFDMSRQGLMKHLRVLADAEVLTTQRLGRAVHYQVESRTIGDAARWFSERVSTWDRQLAGLKRRLEQD
ncbi:helix-turn-helix transcriptional regulator [Yimella sp. cx-573]|nr:helix-turn-helix transcriptional regulator [Yimella sp. cx-573]